jgi:hypothetical protein
VNEVGRYRLGPSYGDTGLATNWSRRIYKHKGVTVYIDQQSRPIDSTEAFAFVLGGSLWCVLHWRHRKPWSKTLKRAEQAVDEWIDKFPSERKGKQPSGEGATRWAILRKNGNGQIGKQTTATTASIVQTAP